MKHTTKPLILILFLVFASSFCFGQNWIWAKQGLNRDTASWSYGWAIATDSSNNVFETGIFDGGTNFGPYLLTTSRPVSQGNFFLTKYDSNGNILWADTTTPIAKNGGYGIYNVGFSVCADKIGNSYITGRYEDSIIFGSDTLKSWNKTTDFFLTKYDPNGNVLWARDAHLLTASDDATGFGVTLDKENNILVTGGGGNNFAFATDTAFNVSFFLVKYGQNGNVKWLQSTSSGTGSTVVTDGSSNIYAAGYYFGAFNIGTYHFATSFYGVFLVKFDSSGNLKWAAAPQSTGSPKPNALACDNAGNIYMTGVFNDSITFGPYKLMAQYRNIYNENIFIVKYGPSGRVIWAKCGAMPADSWASGSSIAVDKQKHLYVSGGFLDTIQFGSLQLKTNAASEFIIEFDTAGNPLFGTLFQAGNVNNGISLSPQEASLYIGGVVGYGYTYHRYCAFGTDTLKSPGVQFAYLAKWGVPDTNVITSVNTINTKEQVVLFPNPNNGQFNLSISPDSYRDEELGIKNKVEIYNALGEKVYSKQLSTVNSQLSINAPAGIYLYRVLTETGTLVGSGKFVIE